MRERWDQLEARRLLLLEAYEIVKRADAGTREVAWLLASTARAIRETTDAANRLME